MKSQEMEKSYEVLLLRNGKLFSTVRAYTKYLAWMEGEKWKSLNKSNDYIIPDSFVEKKAKGGAVGSRESAAIDSDVEGRGGLVVGDSHAESPIGGVPFKLEDTGTKILEEGEEANIPNEVREITKEYTMTGKNHEVVHKILKLVGLKLSNKVTRVKSGDLVISKASLWDEKVRTYKGTPIQILSAINQSKGGKKIESGAVMIEDGKKKEMKKGGEIPEVAISGKMFGGVIDGNTELFDVAKGYKEMGMSNEAIFYETGYFIGLDGKWRSEIDDSSYSFNFSDQQLLKYYEDGKPIRLDLLITHHEFFRIFEKAKSIFVYLHDIDDYNFTYIDRRQDENCIAEFVYNESFPTKFNFYKINLYIDFKYIKQHGQQRKPFPHEASASLATLHECSHIFQNQRGNRRGESHFERSEQIDRRMQQIWLQLSQVLPPIERIALENRYDYFSKNKREIIEAEYFNDPAEIEAREVVTRFINKDKSFPHNLDYTARKMALGGISPESAEEDFGNFTVNRRGGYDYSGAYEKTAEKVGLVTLPKKVSGTNCSNCIFQKNKFCDHKKVLLPVTERMCCSFWDEVSFASVMVNILDADFFPDSPKESFPLNERGGYDYDGVALDRAKAADLITLPPDIAGTNCAEGNCEFGKSGFCKHPKILLPVTDRMSCSLWNNKQVHRSWGKPIDVFFIDGGEISIEKIFKNPIEDKHSVNSELWEQASDLEGGLKELVASLPVEEVAIENIIPTQDFVSEKRISEGDKLYPDFPLLIKSGNKYYVEDGHHRIIIDVLHGRPIMARVFYVDYYEAETNNHAML